MQSEPKPPYHRLQSAGSGSGVNRRTRVGLGGDGNEDDWSVGLNDFEKKLIEREHRRSGLAHVLILSALGIGSNQIRKHLELLFSVDFIDLNVVPQDRFAPQMLPLQFMLDYKLIALRTESGSILVASVTPTDAVIEKLALMLNSEVGFRIAVCTGHAWTQVTHRLGLWNIT